ncbi:hypothetical protein JHK85_052404 [Glycine max]|nr:hypothetical protein JHK85_052404 [Glycine max]
MNLGQKYNRFYPRLRCFGLYKLHSWAAVLTEFEDGRNQESTSEAVNAYYSAALVGLAYGDSSLVDSGSTLVALEILAAQTWWHVKYKRDSKLWWASAECRECRLGIQVLIMPRNLWNGHGLLHVEKEA